VSLTDSVSAGTLNGDLLARVRRVLLHRPVTESELRALCEQVDGWLRALRAQVEASERRLDALAADPNAPLVEVAYELRRVDELLPTLAQARAASTQLEARAKAIRSAWLRPAPAR
jgi:hypothetical protein